VLCLLGSGLVLLSVTRPWAVLSAPHQLTIKQVTGAAHGTRIAGDARALGLLGLAGVLAIAATRRTGRVLVGLVVAASGVAIVVHVAVLLGDGIGPRLLRASTDHVSGQRVESTRLAWPVLTLLGGLVLTAGGLLVAARGRHWAALSSAYDSPVGRATEVEVTDKGVWDALDRGDDPTA
jgi:uncharacterized membrane protein (TIGR02234 family)